MAKRKIHPVVRHGLHIGIPAGLGTFGGYYLALDKAVQVLGQIAPTDPEGNTVEQSFQACMAIIEKIGIFG